MHARDGGESPFPIRFASRIADAEGSIGQPKFAFK
jgi:hypothetical protein